MKSSCPIFLVIGCCFFFSISNGTPSETLATICSQTENQETCESILKSDPRTPSSDLPILSLISIDIATDQSKANCDLFTAIRNTSTDPTEKAAAGFCVTSYTKVHTALGNSYELSKQKKYEDVAIAGPDSKLVYDCENGMPTTSKTSGNTMDMLLKLQTFYSVASYVASNIR